MGKAEMVVVWAAAGAIAAMCLVPPWVFRYHSGGEDISVPAGYSPVFRAPAVPVDYEDHFRTKRWALWSVQLDLRRLAVQCFAAGLVGAALLVTLRAARKRSGG